MADDLPTYTRSTIRCDSDGCDAQLVVERDISEAESYLIAREHGWSAQLGSRAYHWCVGCSQGDDRCRVANVLRYAAEDGANGPHGLHAAIRELSAHKVADAVWAAYYAVRTERPGHYREELLEAARRVEES